MNELVPQSDSAVAQRATPAGSGLVDLLLGRPKLALALTEAIGHCKPVEKNSRNEFHKYNYAGAEAVIGEAREALAKAGLVLLSVEWSLDGHEKEGENRFELRRVFVLMHTSGEAVPLKVVWPVCPDKGRPLDKATAAADTLSLEYLLRDLLLIPRIDPAVDVHVRDDRQQQPARKTRDTSSDGAELEARLVAHEQMMVASNRCKQGELIKFVCQQYAADFNVPLDAVPPFPQWGVKRLALGEKAARAFSKAHPAPAAAAITAQQLGELRALMERKGGEAKVWPRIRAAFNLPRLATPDQLRAALYLEVMKATGEEADAPSMSR